LTNLPNENIIEAKKHTGKAVKGNQQTISVLQKAAGFDVRQYTQDAGVAPEPAAETVSRSRTARYSTVRGNAA
jgi:hypothetical protein